MLSAVLSASVVTEPDVVALVEELQLERLIVTEITEPRGGVLVHSVLDEDCTFGGGD